MKIVTCEFSKISFAAFLLGLFSLSPLAKADEIPAPSLDEPQFEAATQTGVSMAQLRALGVTVDIDTATNSLVFKGNIPESCAKSITVPPTVSYENGVHVLNMDIPACRTKVPADRRVTAASVFHTVGFQGEQDGKFVIRRFANNDQSDPTDDALLGRGGKQLEFTSEKTLQARAMDENARKLEAQRKKDAEIYAQNRKKDQDRLVKTLNLLCRSGDFVGFGAEVEAARGFLSDVNGLMSRVSDLKKKHLEQEIAKAKTAEDMKSAYEAYLDAASENGWDTDKATATYVDKRVELARALSKDSKKSNSEKAHAIRDLAADLRELGMMSDRKGDIGALYFDLAASVREDAGDDMKKLEDAEKFYRASEEFGGNKQRAAAEAEIAKMYNAAADECIAAAKEKGKGFNACDAIAKKAKVAMDKAIKAQGHIKGDASMEALAGMKQEKLARFGVEGYSMSVSGYGNFNRFGGSYDSGKYQAYQQSQQQFIMQYLMRQQMGAYAGSANGTAGAPSGSTGHYFQ